jgi:hypothetical protein
MLQRLPILGRRQGKRIWLLGRLSGDSERDRCHNAPGYPQKALKSSLPAHETFTLGMRRALELFGAAATYANHLA